MLFAVQQGLPRLSLGLQALLQALHHPVMAAFSALVPTWRGHLDAGPKKVGCLHLGVLLWVCHCRLGRDLARSSGCRRGHPQPEWPLPALRRRPADQAAEPLRTASEQPELVQLPASVGRCRLGRLQQALHHKAAFRAMLTLRCL